MAVVIWISTALRRGLALGAEIEVHRLERMGLEVLRVRLVFFAAKVSHPRCGRSVARDPQAVDAGEVDVRYLHRRQLAGLRILVEHGQVHCHRQHAVKSDRLLGRINIVGLGLVFEMVDQEHRVALDAVDLGARHHQHRGAVGASGIERTARHITFHGRRLHQRYAVLVDDEAGVPAADIFAGAGKHVVAQREGLLAAVSERDHGL